MSILRRWIADIRSEATPGPSEDDLMNDPEAWGPTGLGMSPVGSTPTRKKTAAGIRVTPDAALALSAYYACARNIAEDVSKLPLCIYKSVVGVRGKDKSYDHPAYGLIHDRASAISSAYQLREAMTFFAATWGNGYAEIQTLGDGVTPYALWMIHPSRVRPTIVEGEDGGVDVAYIIQQDDKSLEPITLPSHRMLHVRGVGTNGVEGMSMARLGAEAIGVGLAAQDFAGAMFGNDLTLGTVLKAPTALSDKAWNRLKESMNSEYVGARKAFKFKILEEGLDVVRAGIPPRDAQFLEARAFQITEICRWFRMPPHKVAQLDKATFSNIEHQGIEYVTDCLMPWLVRWEQEIQRKLIEPSTPTTAKGGYEARHVVQALMRGDYTARTTGYDKAVKGGWMTPNEVRELEDMNPSTDKNADKLVIQGAMILLDNIGENKPNSGSGGDPDNDPEDAPTKKKAPPSDDDEDATDAYAFVLPLVSPLVQSSVVRLARKWTRTTEDASKKRMGLPDFARWVNDQKASVGTDIETALTPIIASACNALSGPMAKHVRGAKAASESIANAEAEIVRRAFASFAQDAQDANAGGPVGLVAWIDAEPKRANELSRIVLSAMIPTPAPKPT